MKAKKRIISIATVLVAAVLGIVLTSCTKENVTPVGTVIGDKYLDVKTSNKLTSGMSALEMFEAGIKNFNEIQFAASYQTGTVNTKVGFIGTAQAIMSRRVKDGDKLYLDNYTYTTEGSFVDIKAMYEIASDGNGLRRRVADKVEISNGELKAKNWKNTDYYDSYQALMAALPNDPSRVSMINVNSQTVADMTKPEYDRKTQQYTFNITLDAKKASVDYIDLMKFMVANNGISNASIDFTKLELEVVMWKNGLIRSIVSTESYNLKGNKGILSIDGVSDSVLQTFFSYDENEMSYSSVCQF